VIECGRFPPARTSDLPRCRQDPGATGDAFSPKQKMKNLMDVLFGFRKKEDADATAAFVAAKKEKSLASINKSDTTLAQPRVYRTIGLTEARLRARNKQSWMTSTKGWSELFGRFMASAKG